MLTTCPKATLKEQFHFIPRYFSNGLAKDTGRVLVFATESNMLNACELILDYSPSIKIIGLCVHKNTNFERTLHVERYNLTIPLCSSTELIENPDVTPVIFWENCIVPDILYHLHTAFSKTSSAAIFPHIEFGVGRKYAPDFYKDNAQALEAIYSRLADNRSRLNFACVVKSLITGEIEFMPPPSFPEYKHPATLASEGDVIIDAGLFDSTVLRNFALTAGNSGHAYGFEPDPKNYARVLETIKLFGGPDNITVMQQGLFSQKAILPLFGTGASTTLVAGTTEEATGFCELISVDEFAKGKKLEKINLIKMDIEGAELAALQGAEKTIKKDHPKLHICAYHKIMDLIDIPDVLLNIEPEYSLYFASHVPYHNEYVYYAVCHNK